MAIPDMLPAGASVDRNSRSNTGNSDCCVAAQDVVLVLEWLIQFSWICALAPVAGVLLLFNIFQGVCAGTAAFFPLACCTILNAALRGRR